MYIKFFNIYIGNMMLDWLFQLSHQEIMDIQLAKCEIENYESIS
jgi:hypothetical protein